MTAGIGRTLATAAVGSMARSAARAAGATDVGSSVRVRIINAKLDELIPFCRYDQYISGPGGSTGPRFRMFETTPTIVAKLVSLVWKRLPIGSTLLRSRSTNA